MDEYCASEPEEEPPPLRIGLDDACPSELEEEEEVDEVGVEVTEGILTTRGTSSPTTMQASGGSSSADEDADIVDCDDRFE